ncbi:MAG: T9SS type A sorting domain-containing protein, partial [Bacteroidales bacterium]|nr:T9SS type A sorting domain-containing protein [Bacteroidales bacterium]
TTWDNLTDYLPNIAVNCIIYENNSPNGIYIGTDIGVFYRDTLIDTWVNFSGGLPNTVIRDMAIHYNTGKLRVATYGRAVWETELYYIVNIKKEDIFKRTQMQIFPNPAADNIHILLNNNKIQEATILIYDANGRIVKSENIAFNYQKYSMDVADLKDGFYILQMKTKFGIFNEKLILKK